MNLSIIHKNENLKLKTDKQIKQCYLSVTERTNINTAIVFRCRKYRLMLERDKKVTQLNTTTKPNITKMILIDTLSNYRNLLKYL